MKKFIVVFLLILTMLPLFSACSFWGGGIEVPTVKIDYTYENDKWLVIDDRLINKIDGTVHWLDLNRDIAIEGVADFYSDSANVYKYEFEESLLKQYTFLRVYPENSRDVMYYEYVITFNYDGKETERSQISELLTKEEMQKEYGNRTQSIEAFGFCVLSGGNGFVSDRFGLVDKENASDEERIVLDFAEDLYEMESNGGYYSIDGIARPIGNKLWFSTAGTNSRDNLRADPAIGGISETKITSYDFTTKEFETVFEHNEKETLIIDFDEKGAYLLSSSGRLSYVEFETKKQTELYEFSSIYDVTVTDKYICVKYRLNGYSYFVYEKGGSVVANDSALD